MTIIHVSNRVSNQDHINLHELTQIKAAWHAPDAIFNEGGAMAAQDEKFMQESPDYKDEAVPDDLSVVLEFAQMLTGGGDVDEGSRFAADHSWLDASGQLTAAGYQLARALLQQHGTRTIYNMF
ncbi:MAG: hypothetical protein WCF79_07930 [Rhodomicrobium sp.]